ncbi:MAG TPA: hypothetical protein VF916_02410 [Ktedonobacterales bacterium]
MAQDTGEPALLPILQGPDAAPLEHLYRAALGALHEVMQRARATQWQAELRAMLEEWDQAHEVRRFRAARYGLSDLIIHPANFPALNQVQAAWLDRCLDLLAATAHICLAVVRAPDLSGLNAYQLQGMRRYHAAQQNAYQLQGMRRYHAVLQEEVARAQATAQGAHQGRPLEYAIWQVIDHYGGYGGLQGLHSLTGSRCRVCWRRFVTPAEVAFAAAGRWLRPRLPSALVHGHGRQLVARAAACEQDAACRRAQRAIQAAVERYHPPVLQSQEDAVACPHCGTRCNAGALGWDLLEHPLRLRERPSPWT